MPDMLPALAGWIPAIVFPTATLMQLARVLHADAPGGVSALAWLLFGFANLSLYVYSEKYLEPQALSFVLTALLDFAIVWLVMRRSKKAPTQS